MFVDGSCLSFVVVVCCYLSLLLLVVGCGLVLIFCCARFVLRCWFCVVSFYVYFFSLRLFVRLLFKLGFDVFAWSLFVVSCCFVLLVVVGCRVSWSSCVVVGPFFCALLVLFVIDCRLLNVGACCLVVLLRCLLLLVCHLLFVVVYRVVHVVVGRFRCMGVV